MCEEDREGIICLREVEGYNGECPLVDTSPSLAASNSLVARIWEQAHRSAKQVNGKDKVYIYCQPMDVEALLRVHQVDPDDWASYQAKVVMLDDMANDLRPVRKS